MRTGSHLDFEELKKNNDALRTDVIVTELELAITFATSAKTARENDTCRRNLRHSLRAYESAKHFMQKARLDPEVVEYIQAKMNQLIKLLEELGQRADP